MDGTQTLAAISLTHTPISIGGGRTSSGGLLVRTGSRTARLVAVLLAALAVGLLGAPLARAAAPQALTALTPSFVTAGSGPARVVVSPDGKSVYATNKETTTLSQYARNAVSGVLTPLSPATVETGGTPEGITVSAEGKSVYVANQFTNTVSQYSRNTTSGVLTPLSPATVPAGTGPTGIAISADGKSVYAANSTSENVSQYSRNTTTGALTPLTPATIVAHAKAHGIVVSPDGKNAYETNYGAANVSQYLRNTETGALTALTPATQAAGEHPHDLAISADGKNVYVANSSSPGKVSQFSRNAATGLLTPLSPASVAAGEFTEGVVVSPDGNGVYATNEETGNISLYFRNTETGALTAQSPATILAGSKPEGIAISADGKNVYAADNGSSGISQYARNTELPQPPAVLTGAASAVTQTSATLPGSVNPNGQEVTECRVEYGTTNGYGSIASCTSLPGSGSSPVPVSAPVTGLTASTTYHFRIVAVNASGIGNGPDETFTTPSNGPTVVTKAASTVTQTTATLNATANPNGGAVSECKLEYGTTIAYGSSAACTPSPGSGTSPVAVSASVTGLTANTTHHFRISATNAGGTSKGADETLKTRPNAPAVVTKAASAITQTSATLTATVNPNGGEVSECRFEYGTTELYGSSAPCSALPGSGTSPVAVSASLGLLSLSENTTYHFRISATNAGGTSKGADETFKTLPNPPAVVTKAASSVAQTTATLNGTANPNGGEVGECKLEYGTSNAYGSSASCAALPGSGTSAVAVSAAITGLTANTTYHFRVSASNVGGTSKGADETFKTLPNPPTVETKAASAVTQTTATLNGTVNPNGGEVTECKLEYGTTNAYGSSAPCTSSVGSGTSPVAVSAAISGLTANTTYHFRVSASNGGGTSKGADETLKTLPNAPTVVTKAASAITQTSATLAATVNPNAGEVGECKLEYGTTTAYGSSATCSPSPGSGTSPVAVSAAVGGLSPNTTYHFRISATNGGGTSKGADEALKTLPNAPAVVTEAASTLTQTTAALNATVNPSGGEVGECKLEYGTTNAYGSSANCAALPGSGTSPVAVSAAITGLTANTTYHFRISATNAGGTSKGADETLKTLPNAPAVVTKAASAITQTSATLAATVNPNGGEVSECKVEYGATEAYGSSAPCSSLPGSGGTPVAVSASVGALNPNSAYHFRISATNAGGTSKGADGTFKTLPNAPTVETKAPSAVTQTSAKLNAAVNPNGGEVSECKLEYGTTNAYGSSAPCASPPGSGTATVAVSASVSGLSPNTTYHFRISATNGGGTSKGADETLKTLPNAPAVVTKAASAVAQTSATLNATVNPNGGEVGECRFEYGTTEAYGSTVPCSSLPGAGSSPVPASASLGLLTLTENTTYHFRISATNAGGTSKGSDETFKTLPNGPAIEAKAPSAVTQTTATLNGTVNPNGGEVSECRFEYGTTTSYGSTASCTPSPGSGSSPVAVSTSVGSLSPNTTYHFRISATNAGGTIKGLDETAKTLPNAPTVETKAPSAVTQTSAKLTAAVNPNGGDVSECRFEYGTTEAYGSTVPCSSLPGSGSGPVTVSASLGLLTLTENTTYHFRISATNAGGTSKDSDQTFKTLPNPPTVEAKAASGVTQTTATLNGAINPNGGDVSECRFEYGTTTSYGSTASCTPSPGSGNSPVAVSASVGGLSANTPYHFRIVATNAGGTTKGSDEALTTLPNPPTVETKAASALTQTTATLNATVNPNGGEVSECKLEYGTTAAYGSSANCTPSAGSGTSPVSVSAAITGLTANSTYHFRISATNGGGTSKGSDEKLTTLPNAPTVVTGVASSPTQTTATVNATVNPNGGEVGECKLEYGTTTAYGSSAPCASSPGAGISAVAVSASITGLSPNTAYHFRISATNAGGTSRGEVGTLATLPNAPAVLTGTASPPTQTTTTLNATVNPNGGAVTSCEFEFNSSEAYVPCATLPGSQQGPQTVSASVYGLPAGATFRYRVLAGNASGTSYGAIQEFATLPSSALGPPSALEPVAPSLPQFPPAHEAQLTSTTLVVSSGGELSVRLRCTAPGADCRGTITLQTLGAVSASGHPSGKRILTLAAGSFTVGRAGVATVKLRLSGRARNLLTRSRVLRVRATLLTRAPVGASYAWHATVTLLASGAKRG